MAEARIRKRPHSPDRAVDVGALGTATIPVKWVIPGCNELLACRSELFHCESLPGISWQFFFLKDANSPRHVRVWFKCAMDTNKSSATAVSASSSVQLESSNGTEAALKRVLPMHLFRKRNSCWHVRMTEMSKVEKMLSNGGSLVLSGEIVVKLPPGSSSLRRMYETGILSDFTIETGRTTFKVHKAVLAAACPAILDLLPQAETASITIQSSPESVKAMLQYLYDDPMDFNHSELEGLSCDVLLLAENFKLLPLKEMCEAALAEQLKSTNVFKLVGFAEKSNSAVLKNRAFEFVVKGVDTLVSDNSWASFKTDFSTTAMSLCEFVIKALAEEATVGQPKEKAVSSAIPLEIPVRWEIPGFQSLMENSECGFSITCKEKYSHDSMPGIAWELIMYPNGKEDYSHHVALFMRPILTSNKKSQATAPSGGYSLRFEVTNVGVITSAPPPEQTLPVQQFSVESEHGIARFAHQPLVDTHCLTTEKLAVLSGLLLIQPPASDQTLFLRRSFESGNRSDFTIEVNEESFLVHKLILSEASPVMSGMLEMDCEESRNNLLVIKETSVEAVRALLQFWYGDPLCFDGLIELAMDVYKLANSYQDFKLRHICEDALLRMASPENVVHLAAFAADQSCESLEKAAARVILENPNVLEQEAWIQLKDENCKLALMIAEGIITKHRKSLSAE